jgi:hypothetical protein
MTKFRKTLTACAVGALIATSSSASAQSMGQWMAWMNYTNAVGNYQVQQMYNLCTRNPGACSQIASPAATAQAIQNLQNQSIANSNAERLNAWRRENAVNNWRMGAIRGCYQAVGYYGRQVWVCPP